MKNLTRTIVVLSFTASALLIAACSLPGRPASTPTQTFVLQGNPVWQPPPGQVVKPCLSLRVSLPESAPGLNTVRMAYTTEPNRLDYYAWHEWVATPARMIAVIMETRLDKTGMFGAVVSGSSDINTDLRLDSEILSLQQDFSKAGSSVSLAIKVKLVDVVDRSLLASKTFSYRLPASGENAEAGVLAANQAAENFLGELAEVLSASIHPIDCPR